jgi:transcriptional regulator with XRE-family HTH domain
MQAFITALQAFTTALRKLRRNQEWTQLELAERTGIPYWRYVRLGKGRQKPRAREIEALMKALPGSLAIRRGSIGSICLTSTANARVRHAKSIASSNMPVFAHDRERQWTTSPS